MEAEDANDKARQQAGGSAAKIWIAVGALGLVILILVIGKFSGWIDPVAIAEMAQTEIGRFADTPWGPLALILTFCVCAFIAVPQLVLIGVSVFAFGPVAGALWAWFASLCSGTLNYALGRYFGRSVLDRFAGPRVKAFTDFVARNTFLASAIVRNVPAGPFIFVNMVFGAIRASYWQYISGMALGTIPKIVTITFGFQAVLAMLSGNILVSVLAATGAAAMFLGGWFYVRHKRRKGEIVALDPQ